MKNTKLIAVLAALASVAVVGLAWLLSQGSGPLSGSAVSSTDARVTIRVLTYSSFMNAFGPGPEIAKRFQRLSGVSVEYIDSGDAGLLLEKLKLFPSDVVIGLDRLSLSRAREVVADGGGSAWRDLPIDLLPRESEVPMTDDRKFAPYDWAPLAFVYREGEITPPSQLSDLADSRFKGAIALEDPRTSTPGELFLYWALDELGVEKGFDFLARLKPNVRVVASGWSQAYGVFTKGQAKTVLSYLTSPLYHEIEEKDQRYRAAVFAAGHPLSIEYAGLPANAQHSKEAIAFLRFLMTPESQALVMKKNYMLPLSRAARGATPFSRLPLTGVRELQSLDSLVSRRKELLERWQGLAL